MAGKQLVKAVPHSVEDMSLEQVQRAFQVVLHSEGGQVVYKYLMLRLHRARYDCSTMNDPEQILRRQGRAAELTDLLAAFSGSGLD